MEGTSSCDTKNRMINWPAKKEKKKYGKEKLK
jgi:hypothetical protein